MVRRANVYHSRTTSTRVAALARGYRSGLEDTNAAHLRAHGVDAKYEDPGSVIEYTEPASKHRYTPDFVLPNGIIIETKGYFSPSDRKKHLLIKQEHPHLDIRFVFSRAATPINKGSRTTYASWCQKNGFAFAEKLVPLEWMIDPNKNTTKKSRRRTSK